MKELEEAIEQSNKILEYWKAVFPESDPGHKALRLVIEAAEAFRKIALITEYMDFCLRNKTKQPDTALTKTEEGGKG